MQIFVNVADASSTRLSFEIDDHATFAEILNELKEKYFSGVLYNEDGYYLEHTFIAETCLTDGCELSYMCEYNLDGRFFRESNLGILVEYEESNDFVRSIPENVTVEQILTTLYIHRHSAKINPYPKSFLPLVDRSLLPQFKFESMGYVQSNYVVVEGIQFNPYHNYGRNLVYITDAVCVADVSYNYIEENIEKPSKFEFDSETNY